MKNTNKILLGLTVLLFATGCNKADPSFSLPATQSSFSENPTFEVVPQKIDILWVVDTSGSMETSQTALRQNFARFIQKFQSQQYDFHMAVTSTDAYIAKFDANRTGLRILRDGRLSLDTGGEIGTHSGVRVMTRATPNLVNVWNINSDQGIDGSGDERVFSSFEQALTEPTNKAAFRRPDAYLAIISVSDEDDYSSTSPNYGGNNYNAPGIIPVSYYKSFLDTYAGSAGYSFNTISILDNACETRLANDFAGRHIGQRYIQLADLTKGVKASLCDDFGTSLQLISDTIVNQHPVNATYRLGREPVESSIVVKLNGTAVPKDATNGWTYDASTIVVTLHGTASQAIQAGGTVAITYDPLKPTN